MLEKKAGLIREGSTGPNDQSKHNACHIHFKWTAAPRPLTAGAEPNMNYTTETIIVPNNSTCSVLRPLHGKRGWAIDTAIRKAFEAGRQGGAARLEERERA